MYTHACTRKHTPNMRSQSSGCRSLFRVTTLPTTTTKKNFATNLCNKSGERIKRALSPFVVGCATSPAHYSLSPEAII